MSGRRRRILWAQRARTAGPALIMALDAAGLLPGSILAHELAHALEARDQEHTGAPC